MRFILFAAIGIIILVAVAAFPQIDLTVSGLFYRPERGFFLSDAPLFEATYNIVHAASRLLALGFLLLAITAASQRKPVYGLKAKAWLFLFLGLVIGPGLVANVALKDHWGRARPREIVEFGGKDHFTPAYKISNECDRNCSFVSGDGSFGFYLPCFAYVVPLRRSRRTFWSMMGLGTWFAFARLAVGAHFLSDTLYALFSMQAILAGLHGLMFGWRLTGKYWQLWLFTPKIQ